MLLRLAAIGPWKLMGDGILGSCLQPRSLLGQVFMLEAAVGL